MVVTRILMWYIRKLIVLQVLESCYLTQSTGLDEGDREDDGDSADFDKEVTKESILETFSLLVETTCVHLIQPQVEATFQRALTGVNQENVILEINSLRLSCNKSHADCAGALFLSIMKLGLVALHSSESELYQEIDNWKDLLKHYLKSIDEEIEVILKFEEICLEIVTEFSPLFPKILFHLYDKDILSEDAILTWASEKRGADESDKIFVKKSEKVITWLREAPEEGEDD